MKKIKSNNKQIKEQIQKIIELINSDRNSDIFTYVVITETGLFNKATMLTENDLDILVNKAYQKGIIMIFAGMDRYLGKNTLPQGKIFRENIDTAFIISRLFDQSFIPRSTNSNEKALAIYSFYYSYSGLIKKVKYSEYGFIIIFLFPKFAVAEVNLPVKNLEIPKVRKSWF